MTWLSGLQQHWRQQESSSPDDSRPSLCRSVPAAPRTAGRGCTAPCVGSRSAWAASISGILSTCSHSKLLLVRPNTLSRAALLDSVIKTSNMLGRCSVLCTPPLQEHTPRRVMYTAAATQQPHSIRHPPDHLSRLPAAPSTPPYTLQLCTDSCFPCSTRHRPPGLGAAATHTFLESPALARKSCCDPSCSTAGIPQHCQNFCCINIAYHAPCCHTSCLDALNRL